jgi:hypothetical protein
MPLFPMSSNVPDLESVTRKRTLDDFLGDGSPGERSGPVKMAVTEKPAVNSTADPASLDKGIPRPVPETKVNAVAKPECVVSRKCHESSADSSRITSRKQQSRFVDRGGQQHPGTRFCIF